MKLKTKVYVFIAILIILSPYYDKPITITLPSLKQIVSTVIHLLDSTESSCIGAENSRNDYDVSISAISETSYVIITVIDKPITQISVFQCLDDVITTLPRGCRSYDNTLRKVVHCPDSS